MIWHSTDKNDVLKFFNVSEKSGLSDEKAELLLNDINREKTDNKFALIAKSVAKQFNNTASIILLVAVILSAIISVITEGAVNFSTLIILAIMALFGIIAACKNYHLEKFNHNISDCKNYTATVIRNGERKIIPAVNLVPGDIICLSAGDLIPADARLIESSNLHCDEYVLTREVVYVDKDSMLLADDISEIKDRKNMVFSGCSVVSGQGIAVVTEVGSATELKKQKINSSYLYGDKKSEIASVCRYSGFLISAVCVLIFLLDLIFTGKFSTQNFAVTVINSIINCAAIAIACYPESLPSIISVTSSLGVNKLRGINTFVLNPSAIKKVSEISLICADKGEVFTTDNMSVSKIFDGKKITDIKTGNASASDLSFLKLASLCFNETNTDPTDIALLDFCGKYAGLPKNDILNLYPTLAFIPSSEDRKLLTSVKMINGKPFAIVKGAPEELVKKCCDINESAALKISDTLAEEALKVIAVGYKELQDVPAIPNSAELESDLTFAGFIGFETELSANAVSTVKALEKASIRTVMITGDNLITAKAIARRVGILHDNLKAISDEELSKMSDEELDREVTSYAVFARISPQNKFRIIKALQHNNEKTAITGSNAYDAPALRKATVGIALSSSATDVAKDASDLIIENTSLNSILTAIAVCKNTYLSIKRAIHYILSSNLGELLTVLLGLIIFKSPVMLAAQLLLVNLITDTFPALSIGMAPVDTVKISNGKSHIFTMKSSLKLLAEAVLITVISLIGFSYGRKYSTEVAQTCVFAIVGLIQILHIASCYSSSLIIKSGIHKYIAATAFAGLAVITLLLATPLGKLFGIVTLPASCTVKVIILSLIFLLCDELIKFIFNTYKKQAALA